MGEDQARAQKRNRERKRQKEKINSLNHNGGALRQFAVINWLIKEPFLSLLSYTLHNVCMMCMMCIQGL